MTAVEWDKIGWSSELRTLAHGPSMVEDSGEGGERRIGPSKERVKEGLAMWNRACPLCFAKMPRGLVLSKSEELVCPSCRSELELSRPSRVLGALVGVSGGFLATAWVFGRGVHGAWAVGLLAAVLVFGAGSVLALFFLSDLVVRSKEAAALPHPHK